MKRIIKNNRTPKEQEIVNRGLICGGKKYQAVKTGDINELIEYLKTKT